MTPSTARPTPGLPLVADQTGNENDHPASGTETGKSATDPTGAEGTGVDPETFQRWRQITSAMPPMKPEEIAATGLILRRIDARLSGQH